jgi:excisionase family DNA binding protein
MNTNTAVVAAGNFEPLLVSRKIAAQRLGLSVRSIDLLISSERLDCVVVGGRVLIPSSALHDFAKRGTPQRIRPAKN